ncbi:hypothetical protein ACFE04_007074 [Oxalis oulophora]
MTKVQSPLNQIWTLFQEILLANGVGSTQLLVECDNKMVIDCILNKAQAPNLCYPLLRSIKLCAMKFSSISFKHVHREANFSADYLSHYAYTYTTGSYVLEEPPDGISNWINHG